jgi:hypothetical protein
MTFKIGLRKDFSTDEKLVFYIETKNGNSSYTRMYSLNPLNYIKRWIHDISWFIIKGIYTKRDEVYKFCQGCGEGLAEYRIKDPNYGYYTKKKFNCCKHCVNFYDQHWSARKIIGWNIKYDYLDDSTITRVEPILEKKKRMTKKQSEEVDSFLDKIIEDGL